MVGGKKKIRIELEDAEGGKYNLSIEGNLSKDKIIKVVEFMDLLNLEQPEEKERENLVQDRKIPSSVGAKIWDLVDTNFPYSTFTSSDILELYEDRYNEPIKLSTVSTYLSRYSDRGRLARNRQGKEWMYKRMRQSGATITAPSSLQQPELHLRPRHYSESRDLNLDASAVPDLHQ